MSSIGEFRTRKAVFRRSDEYGPHLSGDRYILGHVENARQEITNGQTFTYWKVSEGAFHQDPITYVPPVAFTKAWVTYDQNHGRYPRLRKGGPFRSLKFENNFPVGGVIGSGTYYNWNKTKRYVGGFMPPFMSTANYPESYVSIDSAFIPDMGDLGEKAWKRTKPQLEKFEGLIALRESRDIPGMLKQTSKGFHDIWNSVMSTRAYLDTPRWSHLRGAQRLDRFVSRRAYRSWSQKPREAAEQFLNYSFGWKPFLNDMSDLDWTYQNSKDIVLKLTQQNNKFIRRRVPLQDETTSTKLASGNYGGFNSISYPIHCYPVSFPSEFFASPPSWELWEDKTVRKTAVGKFKFYRPEFDLAISPENGRYDSAWSTVMRYMTIYGLRVSPSNIYKSTPWTWLVDWFTGFGDYLEYLDDIYLDSVVCEYCYAMQHEKTTRRFVQILPLISGTVILEFSMYHETKQREANSGPYSFDPPLSGLTGRQNAILAALAVSKNRSTARLF